MPVIMIPGNHDLNLKNRDQSDSLLSILHRLPKGMERVTYIRNSGVYRYKNLIFGVSSVVDDKIVTIRDVEAALIRRRNGNLRSEQSMRECCSSTIALYHGSLMGAETDTGFKLSGEIGWRSFEGYDFAMLGDIHKFQYVDKNRRMAYAGSLIQQNHGESGDFHGYLRWDMNTGESTLINVPNMYGFCTVKIENAKIIGVSNSPGTGGGYGIEQHRGLLPLSNQKGKRDGEIDDDGVEELSSSTNTVEEVDQAQRRLIPKHARVRFELANTSISDFLTVLVHNT
eukprot:jgi/Bigna1/70664/fgenesh1_pg.12_\